MFKYLVNRKYTTFLIKQNHFKDYPHTQIICLNLRLHDNELCSYKTALVK